MNDAPGPWELIITEDVWRTGTRSDLYTIRDSNGKQICNLWGNEFSLSVALLIAAAPELLAACELSLEWLDEVCNPANEDMRTMEGISVRQAIEAAIAAARGRIGGDGLD